MSRDFSNTDSAREWVSRYMRTDGQGAGLGCSGEKEERNRFRSWRNRLIYSIKRNPEKDEGIEIVCAP